MSEIEKLYKNAGVLKECLSPCYINKTWRKTHDCPNCDNRENYPPFTAEKQLSLIKFLANFWVHINKVNEQFNISTGGGYVSYYAEDLADAIALYINSKWNNLTEQERTEIRSILNG